MMMRIIIHVLEAFFWSMKKTCIKSDFKRRIAFSHSYSPVSQNVPVYMQVLHSHVAVVPTGTQVPPF